MTACSGRLTWVLNGCVLRRPLKCLRNCCVCWESCVGEHRSVLRGGAGSASSSREAGLQHSQQIRHLPLVPPNFAVQRHHPPGQEWQMSAFNLWPKPFPKTSPKVLVLIGNAGEILVYTGLLGQSHLFFSSCWAPSVHGALIVQVLIEMKGQLQCL